MTERYYLDSCIWIDYFENRSDRFRPLGDWAFSLIQKIVQDSAQVIISDMTRVELEKQFSSKIVDTILEIIPRELLVIIEASEKQSKEAMTLSKKLQIPFGDALHGVLARDSGAILVTRDKHFNEMSDQLTVRKPEELI